MTAWRTRSRTQAAMLNPALLAVVIASAASEYERADGVAMPWPLSFLVAPFVLHRRTRDALPRSTVTHLGNWVAQNPVIHAGFGARAQSLSGVVREGLRFGLVRGSLTVDNGGRLSGTVAARPRGTGANPELDPILTRAGFVGRWLTKVDQPATAFILLGVAP
jgi:hypothetical protein